MAVRELYQTLRYLDNNDIVLKEGPYKCVKDNAWLGHGYYFWEDSLKPAKYWGEKFHDNKYIVFKGTCNIDEENCFHLYGSVKHMELLEEAIKKILELGELYSNVTVPHIINFLQMCGQFPFYASKAETSSAFDKSAYLTEDDFKEDVIFNKRLNISKVKLHLAVQVCIYDLEKIGFKTLEIAYENH